MKDYKELAKEAARRAHQQVTEQRKLFDKPLLLPTEFKCPFLHKKGRIVRLMERAIVEDPDTVKEWNCILTWRPCKVIYPDLPTASLCALETYDEDTFVSLIG